MSKYFGFVNNKPYDFEFKPHPHEGWKLFYLGATQIATLIPPSYKPGWSVIVHKVEDLQQTPSLVEGFVSRHSAINYALKVHTDTRDTYNTDRATKIHEQEFLKKEAEKCQQTQK